MHRYRFPLPFLIRALGFVNGIIRIPRYGYNPDRRCLDGTDDEIVYVKRGKEIQCELIANALPLRRDTRLPPHSRILHATYSMVGTVQRTVQPSTLCIHIVCIKNIKLICIRAKQPGDIFGTSRPHDPFPLEVFHRLHAGPPLVGIQMRIFPTRLFGPAPFFERFLSKWRHDALHRDACNDASRIFLFTLELPRIVFLYVYAIARYSCITNELMHLTLQLYFKKQKSLM